MTDLGEAHSSTKLLKAALEVFSEEGFHGATTKKIAERAQVNESLITRHFKSKQGLFLSVLDANVSKRRQSLNYPLQKSVEEELISFSDHMIASSVESAQFSKIVLSHALQSLDFADDIRSHLTAVADSLLAKRLEQVAALEGLAPFDYHMVESITHKIIYMGTLYSVYLDFQDVERSRVGIHAQIRFFWAGIRQTLVK